MLAQIWTTKVQILSQSKIIIYIKTNYTHLVLRFLTLNHTIFGQIIILFLYGL